MDRRKFIKSSGLALGAASGLISFRARAELTPARIRIGHLTDTRFSLSDDAKKTGEGRAGWLIHDTHLLARDVLALMSEQGVDLVIHSGGITEGGGKKKCAAAESTLNESSAPVMLTCGDGDVGPGARGRNEFVDRLRARGVTAQHTWYSFDRRGFHFIHLDAGLKNPMLEANTLFQRDDQLVWLDADLGEHTNMPTVLCLYPPLRERGKNVGAGLGKKDCQALANILRSNPQIILVLSGLGLANRAWFSEGALCLTTSSTSIYPCGARWLELTVEASGMVSVDSQFIPTRRKDLIEKSYYYLGMGRETSLASLGERTDRNFIAEPATHRLEARRHPLSSPEPLLGSKDSVTLAVLSDTHICTDRIDPADASRFSEQALAGHLKGEESWRVYRNVLDRIGRGVHRVEFYDQVFKRDPENPAHYREARVDALIISGDLTEHGRVGEAEILREGLAELPSEFSGRALLAIGNHDMYDEDIEYYDQVGKGYRFFAHDNEVSSRDEIAEFFSGFGPEPGSFHYVRHLTDWLSVIVLDTVIPVHDGLAVDQDQLDWLEDQLVGLKDRALLVVSHHPLYAVNLVPAVMQGMARLMYDFTPAGKNASRARLDRIFKSHPNVKALFSGHYHGASVEQHPRENRRGGQADDPWITQFQVPAVVEYPCAYRLITITRSGSQVELEYAMAYTTEFELRQKSSQGLIYRAAGRKIHAPVGPLKKLWELPDREDGLGELARADLHNALEMNVRGFKDGTANAGRGNTGRDNRKGKLSFTI